jgi:hypothetical protein
VRSTRNTFVRRPAFGYASAATDRLSACTQLDRAGGGPELFVALQTGDKVLVGPIKVRSALLKVLEGENSRRRPSSNEGLLEASALSVSMSRKRRKVRR